MKSEDKIIVFGDGGSRGNPGEAAYGFAVFSENEKLLHKEGERLGIQTNNFAEYSAVINALRWIIKNNPKTKEVLFKLDSLLVASQMSGKYKVKHPQIRELFITAKSLESNLPAKISYLQIPREQNKVADKLVNDALDYII